MQAGTAIVVAGVVCALFPTIVLAHDEAHWIERNPSYSAATGKHCCGPKDCYRISADLVHEDGHVIIFLETQHKFRRGMKGTYLSETDDWWMVQMVPLSPDSPSITAFGDIAGLHKTWENLNLRCRKLPHDSPEGEAACSRREVLGSQLRDLGWCVRYMGLEIKWDMCPRTGR